MTTIVWFRQDLRVRDNPALAAAASRGSVMPLYVLDDVAPGPWRMGAASRWWLHHSLAALTEDIGQIVLARGDPRIVVPEVVKATGASAVYWNRCYEPFAIARDKALKAELASDGIEVKSFNASLLHEPWEVETRGHGPFRVFTPFWRAASAQAVPAPLRAPPTLSIAPTNIASDQLNDWELLPRNPDWASKWLDWWRPGEAGALARFDEFVADGLAGYAQRRDRPELDASSCLSPHLHFGEISPRQIWARLSVEQQETARRSGVDKFLSELGWREFAHHLLFHFPKLPDENWRDAFDAYPWLNRKADLDAWQQGRTGYPFVDAAMRQLWHTGWVHNRARMVAASFLVKHLRVDWRLGEAWFWDTLVDADLANNAAGWQWVAGSGADAAPYFRIFNPIIQGQKFDPDGEYVRRWCPELAPMPREHIHAPFKAPAELLARCGIRLGTTYPHPIVAHEEARRAALAGYEQIRTSSDGRNASALSNAEHI
jgi:deoxyribodipyrimidine photo-lyase